MPRAAAWTPPARGSVPKFQSNMYYNEQCLFKLSMRGNNAERSTFPMLSTYFGELIRKERLARGLTQSETAGLAHVSRSVLSRLEQGKPRPVQTDVLDRLFKVLNMDSTGASRQRQADALLEERRRARLEHRQQLDRQRIRHLRLAAQLAGDPVRARPLIAAAKRVVALWARNRTCSPFYIRRWSRLLALPPRQLALEMAALGEWEDALFQNTPWSRTWT